jgi:CIC family chloride channel protein
MTRARELLLVVATAAVAALLFGWLEPVFQDLLDWVRLQAKWVTAFAPAAGAAVAVGIVVLARVTPATADDYARGLNEGRVDVRSAPARLAALVAGVGFGVPLGYEGPAVYFGGAAGAVVPQRRGWRERPAVLAAATAAVTMVINAPLASALFAVEVARRGRPRRADVVALAAGGAAGWAVLRHRHGSGGIVGTDPGGSLLTLVATAAVVVVVVGIVARVFVTVVRRAKEAPALSPSRRIAWAVIPLLIAVPLAQFETGYAVLFGSGYQLMSWAGHGDTIGVVVLLAIFIGLVGAMVRAGVVGGLFLPMLAIGATVGVVLDRWGMVGAPPAATTLIGAAVMLAGAYGCPLAEAALVLSGLGWSTATVVGLAAVAAARLFAGSRSVSIYQT